MEITRTAIRIETDDVNLERFPKMFDIQLAIGTLVPTVQTNPFAGWSGNPSVIGVGGRPRSIRLVIQTIVRFTISQNHQIHNLETIAFPESGNDVFHTHQSVQGGSRTISERLGVIGEVTERQKVFNEFVIFSLFHIRREDLHHPEIIHENFTSPIIIDDFLLTEHHFGGESVNFKRNVHFLTEQSQNDQLLNDLLNAGIHRTGEIQQEDQPVRLGGGNIHNRRKDVITVLVTMEGIHINHTPLRNVGTMRFESGTFPKELRCKGIDEGT
jgi:hypothetical protein